MRWSWYVSIVAGSQLLGRDRETVGVFDHLDAKFSQLSCDGADSIGFLMPNVADVANCRRAFGEERDDGERLHRVADRVHVDIDAT